MAEDHEQVIVRSDPETGMQLVVAVHSTALGPALGGMRLRPYPGGLDEAVADARALAGSMTLKAAAAGLDLGGGKAVMLDDGLMAPGEPLRELRLLAAGHVVDELGGSYVTAEDVGTTPQDMDVIARATRYVVGRSPSVGGGGDPSPFTAAGVQRAMEVGLEHALGARDLSGRRVGALGLGKVGLALSTGLLEAGAEVLAYDIDAARLAAAADAGATPASSADEVLAAELDVLAPCAVGGLVTPAVADTLRCAVVCGAANNQLASRGVANRLAARDILYVPDFMANCGGLVHVAAEWDRLEGRPASGGVDGAAERLEQVLSLARREGITPLAAAERVAMARIEAARPRAHAA
jgi:valine dehydrogenase (NAD+)